MLLELKTPSPPDVFPLAGLSFLRVPLGEPKAGGFDLQNTDLADEVIIPYNRLKNRFE
jgi:hypothetical protein